VIAVLSVAASLSAGDWPQWRGPARDGKAIGFEAPKTWPKDLVQKWKVTVGRGDGSPALVGDKLFVFTRDDLSEVTLCLDAATGKELWKGKYDALPSNEPRGEHPGPRSTPTVAGGKVVTYGVRGTLSCLDAATGKMLWRKDDFAGVWPKFFTSSSPIIVNNLCIAQLGGDDKGGIVAYDLATGDQKWKWEGDGTGYASPTTMTAGDVPMLVTLTAKKIVGISVADGKLLWEAAFPPQQRAYNSATPIIDGQTVIYTGAARGMKAVKIEKAGDAFAAKELWSVPDTAVQFNSPVLKDGRIYGITQKGALFCVDAKDGKTLWTAPFTANGFGSIVDAGSVLMALAPEGDLTIVEPSEKEFKKLASYKVGVATYAYPVPAGNKIYIRDKDSLTLWGFE
jgi:outer membrane protein assembly factor BamB